MKKTSLIIGLALLVAPLAGCDFGDKTISVENISLSETNLNIYVGDSKTLTATVTPDNATDKTVTWSVAPQGVVSVNEGAVSAIAAGECVITAKAGEKEATCNVKVEERIVPVNEQYYISEVNQNANIQTYKLNTGESTDYKGAIERLQVGTDNAFVMKPNLLVYSEETDLPVDSSVWTYPYEYKIEELDGASFVDAKATYAEFDASKASFNFNENAVGKTLKLSVMPGGLDAIDQADPRFTKTIEVNVAEGYNVYSAKELAYFDDPVNCSHRWATEYSLSVEQTQAAWTKFREENGLDKTYVADNIFLQSNIEITTKDIPSEFIYSEGQGGKVGYLRDSTDIYFKENRNTLFNGNYFDINTSKLPMADVDPDWDNISHTTLFKVYEARTDVAGEQVFKNCSYFGNGARSENETPKGGLIFVKFCSVNDALQSNVSFSNFNMEAALISLYVESHARVTVDSCDIEQGFSNFMYVYHKGIIDIKNEQNIGYVLDKHSKAAEESILNVFGCKDGEVFFLTGGTQANMIVLSYLLKPYEAVICCDTGHINVHETGAVEGSGEPIVEYRPSVSKKAQ